MESEERPGNAANLAQPDAGGFGALTDRSLCVEIERMIEREREISFQRRYLHGQIRLARAELARRLTLDTPLDIGRRELAGLERLLDGIDLREER